MKRLFVVFLAILMLFSLGMTASAKTLKLAMDAEDRKSVV